MSSIPQHITKLDDELHVHVLAVRHLWAEGEGGGRAKGKHACRAFLLLVQEYVVLALGGDLRPKRLEERTAVAVASILEGGGGAVPLSQLKCGVDYHRMHMFHYLANESAILKGAHLRMCQHPTDLYFWNTVRFGRSSKEFVVPLVRRADGAAPSDLLPVGSADGRAYCGGDPGGRAIGRIPTPPAQLQALMRLFRGIAGAKPSTPSRGADGAAPGESGVRRFSADDPPETPSDAPPSPTAESKFPV